MDRQEQRSFEAMEQSTTSAIPTKFLNKSLASAQNGVQAALIESLLNQPLDSPTLPNVIGELASLSRESEDLRNRLSRDAVLEKLLDYLDANGNPEALESTTAAVRCLGNGCISNQDACKTVAKHGFSWARLLLETNQSEASSQLQGMTIKALYNLCSRSEDAQVQCYHDSIHYSIIEALSGTNGSSSKVSEMADENLSAAVDVLLSITSHFTDLGKGTTPPNDMERRLLGCPHLLLGKLDVEDHAALLEVVLTFLRDSAMQTQVVKMGDVALVWRILGDNEYKIRTLDDDSVDDNKMLKALSTSLVWILSDLAAHPLFTVVESHNFSFTDYLATMIADSAGPQNIGNSNVLASERVQSRTSLTAACQILGNMVHSLPPTGQAIWARKHRLHDALLADMVSSDDAEFLHSAAGLLIQLSRPNLEIREQMGCDKNAVAAVKMLSEHPNQQLKSTALSLMRALGKEVPAVQDRFRALAGKVMAEVAEEQKFANGKTGEPAMPSTSMVLDASG